MLICKTVRPLLLLLLYIGLGCSNAATAVEDAAGAPPELRPADQLRQVIVGTWTLSTDEDDVRVMVRAALRDKKKLSGAELDREVEKNLAQAVAEARELAKQTRTVFSKDTTYGARRTQVGRWLPNSTTRTTWTIQERDGRLFIITTRELPPAAVCNEEMRVESFMDDKLHLVFAPMIDGAAHEAVVLARVRVAEANDLDPVAADVNVTEVWKLRQKNETERIALLKSYFCEPRQRQTI